MDPSTTALLAALATIASGMVSALVTVRLFGMGKVKDHESRLFEKRAECYPTLYRLLSDFIKVLEFGTLTEHGLEKAFSKKQILEHIRELEPWDSAYAILTSDYTIDLLFAYRYKLYELLEQHDDDFAKAFHRPNSHERQRLIEQSRQLEAAIRWEMRTHLYAKNEVRAFQKGRSYRLGRRKYLVSYTDKALLM